MAEENPHAQAGYQAGKAKAYEHKYLSSPVWRDQVLSSKADDAAQAHRWQFSEQTDLPLSEQDWYAYRDAFIRGYNEPLAQPAP